MIYYTVIFGFQFSFNILKTLEIKYTYQNKVKLLLWNSLLINSISLGALYFSLDRLFEGDLLVIPFYLAGSILGKWIAMTQLENYRNLVYRLFSTDRQGTYPSKNAMNAANSPNFKKMLKSLSYFLGFLFSYSLQQYILLTSTFQIASFFQLTSKLWRRNQEQKKFFLADSTCTVAVEGLYCFEIRDNLLRGNKTKMGFELILIVIILVSLTEKNKNLNHKNRLS